MNTASSPSQLPAFTAGVASPHKPAAAARSSSKPAEKSRQRINSRPTTAEMSKGAAQDAVSRLQEVIDLTKDRAQPRHSSQKTSGGGDDVIDLEPEATDSVPPAGNKAQARNSFTTQFREALAEHFAAQTEQQAGPDAMDDADGADLSERPPGQNWADLPQKSSKAGREEWERQGNSDSKPGKEGSKAANAQQGIFVLFCEPRPCSDYKLNLNSASSTYTKQYSP